MARKDWTNSQHGEYQRLMMIADTVRDNVANGYFPRPESTGETIGGMRISDSTYNAAMKLVDELHTNGCQHTKRFKLAQAIIGVDVWRGDNAPHWIKVRDGALDELREAGIETESMIKNWLYASDFDSSIIFWWTKIF
jgi:hypothetical protein